MVGQQFISNFIETLLPTIVKWWKDRKAKKRAKAAGYVEMIQTQWVDDYEGTMCYVRNNFICFLFFT